MKKIIIFFVLTILVSTNMLYASPMTFDVDSQITEKLSLDGINSFIKRINSELNEDLPYLNTQQIKDVIANGIKWDDFKSYIWSKFAKEIMANMHLMGKLLFLAVLCVLLQNLHSSFESTTISILAYGICFVFLVVIALTAFYNVLDLVRVTISYAVGFMEALLPLLITLLAGVGALTSVALFTPLMLFVINAISLVVKDIILPMMLLTSALECVNFMTDKYRLSNLAGVFKQASMAILGLTLVIFIGVISIQGVAGGISDGLALRTAKYATSTFVPVVGKMFSDTVELVMGASLLIKNAIGIFGVITVLLICVYPIVKLISLIVIVKVTGALIQPMGDERMAKCLDSIGNNLMLVFGALLTVMLMLFLSITMIIGAGSMAMMLR